jgi:signal transduction histidine kinase
VPANLLDARKAVDGIVKDANRASDVITRVRNLARKTPLHKQALDINESIREIVKLTDAEIQQGRISLRTQLSHDLQPVLGDPVQLQQVLLNLILNAIEAVTLINGGPRELTITTSEGRDATALVTVRDSGPGFGTDKFERLFDAFYTTKARGTGMGLAIARSILEDHGGHIWAAPNTPRGASFLFTLPLIPRNGSGSAHPGIM